MPMPNLTFCHMRKKNKQQMKPSLPITENKMDNSEKEQREICRQHIESLEHWSRRVIDEEMKKKFGNDYFSYTNTAGHPILRKELIELVKGRMQENPLRYPRSIDAILFDDIAYFLCREDFYKESFKSILEPFFSGQSEVRSVLERLKDIRNKLSHGNAISAHEAEQTICYTNDFIETYKVYYQKSGHERDYNIPLFIKLTDSLGRTFIRTETYDWTIYDHKRKIKFHSGERYKVWVDVDSNFSPNSYSLNWSISFGNKEKQVGSRCNSLEVIFTNEMVGYTAKISCRLKTKNDWHKIPYSECDDVLRLDLDEILPPVDSNY